MEIVRYERVTTKSLSTSVRSVRDALSQLLGLVPENAELVRADRMFSSPCPWELTAQWEVPVTSLTDGSEEDS